MKIVHLIDSGGLYGAEKMLLSLSKEQIKQGLQPTILSCGVIGEGVKAIEQEAKRLGIECITWRMKAGLNIKGMHSIWRWVHSKGFTHVHSHGYKFNILLALTRKAAVNIRLITTVHGYVAPKVFSRMWFYLHLDRWALLRLDNVVFVSKAMPSQAAFKSLKFKNTSVINNGMNFTLFSSEEKTEGDRVVDKLHCDDRLIGFVGRLSHEKGLDFLIQAFSRLRKDHPNIKLLLCGTGPSERELRKRVKQLDLSSSVIFAGFVNDVASALKKIDIFVMPSLTEGMPMVLMEAIAAKKNIIATKVGGMPEMLSDYKRSLLVPHGDAELLQDAIAAFLGDSKLVTGDVSQSVAAFSASRMAESYRSVYLDSIVGGV